MIPALLTAVLFAGSALFGQRAAQLWGPLRANALRLSLASAVLGALTLALDALWQQSSLQAAVFPWFFLSGLLGFGLGDIGLFLAYPRLGARQTILVNFSLGTLCAAWGDHWLLGEPLARRQWLGVVFVLAGLGVALWPRRPEGPAAASSPWSGWAFASLAGAGQGFGTTLSGLANRAAEAQHLSVHGISQAFQRSTAGVLVGILAWGAWQGARPARGQDPGRAGDELDFGIRTAPRRAAGAIAGAAFLGPVAGVSCYQWARLHLPSAVVVALAATSALWVIPLAKWMDGDHPTRRQILGTGVAVGGIAVLCLAGKAG